MTSQPNETPSPTPLTASSISSNLTITSPSQPQDPVKTAPIDTILFDENSIDVQLMTDIIFENIAGQELINIARTDTVNGQPVAYQPIKNLTQINQQYNPNNILSLQATSDKYFQNFSIKFENKVPSVGGGPDGEHVYIDPSTGDLIVEVINVEDDEQVEVEIALSGTIYRIEL